ncbi:MAG: hypothetical protein B6D59_08230 [Campylobacteraceae bacterium 4484_4]|uniref:hypothetical protein n=1 Tax=Hydrogenimonas sp. TaxID=2231112 RepID=UPI000A0C709F|nr:hypothetical protein [Hydrogenimonas sp.]OQX72545.1 MAG: hypothetical protein B6D59_08230 [Campylobacteraceae bacterium 4484_4]
MFNQGLSLDQAPPFEVVLRFFLTIPFFGILTALALLGADLSAIGVWDAPQTVAIVHLVVLGMAGMAMVGALFQMLPVLAGASIRDPIYHARWIHALMALGTIMLSGGFFYGVTMLFHTALVLLLGSLGFVVFLMFSKLLRVENKTPSVVGMIVAIAGLGFGLFFAFLVMLVFIGVDIGLAPQGLRTIHMHFMLFGWIAALIMAVAFQVIEMFYVTPPYPESIRKWFPMTMLAILVLQVPFYLISGTFVVVLDIAVGILLALFALVTLKRLTQRKRPVADTTVWLWRTGLSALLAAVLFAFIYLVVGNDGLFNMAALLFGYFVVSIIFAMSYKIIPFLVWFHLNAKGVMECPMMGDIIVAKRMKWHLWTHWALIATAAAALVLPLFWKVTAILFLAESLLFGTNLFGAARIYNNLKDKGLLS